MSNVSDLTLEVLKNIRTELKGLREDTRKEMGALREELRDEIGALREETRAGFAEVNTRLDGLNHRIDGVLKIVGTHYADHETRLRRIEQHLKLRRKS